MPLPSSSSPPQLLIVDDEPRVLSALKEVLERQNFAVTASTDPEKAIELLHQRTYAAVLSDQIMPQMTGLEFLVECRRIQPMATRVLITGVQSLPTLVEAINRGEIYRFLAKPWLREELIATVRNAINRYDLLRVNDRLLNETSRLNTELRNSNTQLAQRVQELEDQGKSLNAANTQLANSYERSLDLCSRILATFDPFLAGQTRAIVETAQQMAEAPNFTTEERHALRTAAWACDLGLIGVSRELVRTFRRHPERLTDREIENIQAHPIYSQTLVANVDASNLVAETVRAHHERFDGEGFPDGLAGTSIPWPARCLAVAVFYVECGLPKPKALEAITRESGRSLDPEAVRLFFKITHLLSLPRTVREIMFEDLQPGMILANGLYSPHGMLLVSEGQSLSASTISKLRNHNLTSPISQRLLVYS